MPSVVPGALAPVPGIKWGSIDIREIRLGSILVYARTVVRDDFDDSSVAPGLGPNWADHGPAVAPYQATVINDSYARIDLPDHGVISPGIAMQTSRYRYSAALIPTDDGYFETQLGHMGSWRSTYRTRIYMRLSNNAFSDGVGLSIASTGEVYVSRLIGNAESTTLIGHAKSGDVLRFISSNRTFTVLKNGRWFGSWTDTNTTALGIGFRSVGISWMASKDGPIGARQVSPSLNYIEANGGENSINIVSSRYVLVNSSQSPSVLLDKNYIPRTGDLILVCNGAAQSRAITVPAGWTNVLGGNSTVDNTQQSASLIYHVVTAAEEQAGTVSWALKDYYTTRALGFVTALALRGCDPVTPINKYATGFSAVDITPHTMPALPPAGLNNRSLVLSFMERNQSPRSGTLGYPDANTPAGYTQIMANNSGYTSSAPWNANLDTGSRAVYQRNALTQSGVPVPAKTVDPGHGPDEYVAFTVALNVKTNT